MLITFNLQFNPPFNLETSCVLCLVCVDIKLKAVDDKLKWSIGPCSSGKYKSRWDGTILNTDRCCLAPGKHVLTCKSNDEYIWRQGYVEIQGRSGMKLSIGTSI